jgi:hypothetical protein
MSLKTVWFLPPGAKTYFLEWGGNQPDVELHLARMEHDIEKKSRVPAIAYGAQPQGALSGVALRILYGPLLSKTQSKWASWGPSLEYLMFLTLRAEGFDVRREAVNALWEDPLPQDEMELMSAEKTAVETGFRSIESAMARTGTENPRREAAEVFRDHRFDQLKLLTDAGTPLIPAMVLAGFSEEEAAEVERVKAEEDAAQQEQDAARFEQQLAARVPANGRIPV